MKAAQISEYGGSSAVQVVDIDKPKVGDGQVLVEVNAASLNPFDTKIREGYMKDFIPLQFPVTLGGDIAGVVSEVGVGVTNVSVGDNVYGNANAVGGNSGAFAEFAVTKAEELALMPKNTSFEEAAAVTLVGVSAWQALVQHLDLKSGQKIFISGGAGGIGSIAVMIAKHLGAYVAVSASGEGLQAAKSFGADEVIDYKTQEISELLRDYDALFDTVGDAEVFASSLMILKKGGIAVTMGMGADQVKAAELGITVIGQGSKITTVALNELTKLIESGVVKPQIGKVYSLDQVVEAFEARENGSITGKIVLAIKAV